MSIGRNRPALLLFILCFCVFVPVYAQEEEPRPKYELSEEAVTYPSGDISLSGVLYVPEIEPPYRAVVIVMGSGRSTLEVYRPLAERIAVYGFATLVYDKRGTGNSEGRYSQVGTSNGEQMISLLASDVLAGVRYLQSRDDIDETKIGLIGSSQAGWIIPEAVSQANMDEIGFMVNLVGPTVSIGHENLYSRLTGGRDELNRDYAEIAAQLAEYTGPSGYDPLPALEMIETPGLWILGGADSSIPTPETVAILEALIAAGKPYSIHLYPTGNHGLTDLETGERINYTPEMMEWVFGVLETEEEAVTE